MTSAVSICNLALMRLGTAPITSLSEDTKAATVCNAFYEPCRDALLRSHPWNFAIKRVELAQDLTAPEFEFAYRYALPADFQKIVRTEDESASCFTEYRIENGFLLTDAGTVKIEYHAKITDPNAFDSLFVMSLALSIAIAACMWLTDNASLKQSLQEEYGNMLPEARSVDAQEGTPRNIEANEWVVARA